MVVPLNGRVLVEHLGGVRVETKRLVLPDSSAETGVVRGRVVSASPDSVLSEGAVVHYDWHRGTECWVGDLECRLLLEKDVAVVEVK